MGKIAYYFAKFIRKIQIPAIKNSAIFKTSKIMAGCHIVDSNIGRYSYVGYDTSVINVEIGNFCSIAGGCSIGGASHPVDWISTSPVFQAGRNCLKKNFSNNEYISTKKTTIGNDVWIGENCLIKAGITIGDGAVIGMGTVLTKNVNAYEIWAGNPAKLIRKRFNDEIIKSLLKIKWWNWDDKVINKFRNSFKNPNEFIEKLEA